MRELHQGEGEKESENKNEAPPALAGSSGGDAPSVLHKSIEHVIQLPPLPLPRQRVPLLQESQKGKHRVRSTSEKDPLDHHLH